MTKTCLQCGAVLPSSLRACSFCDSSFVEESSSSERDAATRTQGNLALRANLDSAGTPGTHQDLDWRGEVARRLRAHRLGRRRLASNSAQSHLPFEDFTQESTLGVSAALAEPTAPPEEDFSFTIAIGRPSKKHVPEDTRMLIEVSPSPHAETESVNSPARKNHSPDSGLFPIASLDDRRMAGLIDLGCLLFAYGGFMALFGSLGGEFTLTKLSAVVYLTTFAIVYLQFFALFTVFGGTTPGMMMRGLQVVTFSGEPPTPRQMLQRSAGYMLSAGTFFLGFLWALWDEDGLTWHDRLSHTYLSQYQTFADMETSGVAHGR